MTHFGVTFEYTQPKYVGPGGYFSTSDLSYQSFFFEYF